MSIPTRRSFLAAVAAACGSQCLPRLTDSAMASAAADFEFRYIVASCMYGYMYLGEILPEVTQCGASHIDIWPKRHGNQREQLHDMGEELFLSMLQRHKLQVGCLTQYPLGPFKLQDDMRLAKRLGCPLIITAGTGQKGLAGAENMKPHLAVAEENGVIVAIENHANDLFETTDGIRYLNELRSSANLGIALAPYHLPQDAEQLAALIRELGSSLQMFYAWQHGDGCMTRLPKEQELLQMPGRGPLDFGPLVKALVDIKYQGWTEIFMHPVPRGIPILETAQEVTAEINKSREYLAERLKSVAI